MAPSSYPVVTLELMGVAIELPVYAKVVRTISNTLHVFRLSPTQRQKWPIRREDAAHLAASKEETTSCLHGCLLRQSTFCVYAGHFYHCQIVATDPSPTTLSIRDVQLRFPGSDVNVVA